MSEIADEIRRIVRNPVKIVREPGSKGTIFREQEFRLRATLTNPDAKHQWQFPNKEKLMSVVNELEFVKPSPDFYKEINEDLLNNPNSPIYLVLEFL